MWGRRKRSILWFAQLDNSHPSFSQSERNRFVLHLHANALPSTPNSIYITKAMRICSLHDVMYLLMKGVYFFSWRYRRSEDLRALWPGSVWGRNIFVEFEVLLALCTPPSSEVHRITQTDSTLANTPFIFCPNFCFSRFFFPFVSEGASVYFSVDESCQNDPWQDSVCDMTVGEQW